MGFNSLLCHASCVHPAGEMNDASEVLQTIYEQINKGVAAGLAFSLTLDVDLDGLVSEINAKLPWLAVFSQPFLLVLVIAGEQQRPVLVGFRLRGCCYCSAAVGHSATGANDRLNAARTEEVGDKV
jgi:hypothetical protein